MTVDPSEQVGAPRKRGRPRNLQPSAEYQARLENIVSEAAKVFHASGYEAGSLDDVAAALGLRKASLYYYVKRKSDLLRLVFERAITTALSEVDHLGEIDDPEERLAALIRYQALLVAGDPSLFAVFFGQRSGLEEQDLANISRKERRYIRHFVVAVEAAMAAGALPAGDPRLAANAVIGMTSWAYKWFDPRRDSPERFADECVRLLLHRAPPTGDA